MKVESDERLTLNYGANDPAARRPLGPSLKLAMTIVFDSAIIFALFQVAPHIRSFYGSYQFELPGLTKAWLSLAGFFNDDYGWVLFMLIVMAAVVFVVTTRPALLSDPAARSERAAIRLLLLGLFGIPVVFAIFAMVLPYFAMIGQLASPQTGR